MPADRTPLTPKQVAGALGVTPATVLAWIRGGELRAVNVSRSVRSKKPRWRIPAAALEAFEVSRSAAPAPAATRPRRGARDSVITFYK